MKNMDINSLLPGDRQMLQRDQEALENLQA